MQATTPPQQKPPKKKYPTKKCPHGRNKSVCRPCGGASICPHDRIKYQCRECKGGAFCVHDKLKSRCELCGGSQLCTHGRLKSYCAQCGGSQICSHGKQRSRCQDCEGGSVCQHGSNRYQCKQCDGRAICEHQRRRAYCTDCEGSQICDHQKTRSDCRDCNGSNFCTHGRRKAYCSSCGGSQLCITPYCETTKNPKTGDHCMRCHVYLYPDNRHSRNHKTKEFSVVDFVTEAFSEHEWVNDRIVSNGCSRRRPDLFLDLGTHVLMVEIDERGDSHPASCDNRRTMELSEDVAHRPMVVLRFNPDSYTDGSGTRVMSCWRAHKRTGILAVPVEQRENWSDRLEALRVRIDYYIGLHDPPDRTITEEFLFFNENVVEQVVEVPQKRRRVAV